MNPGSEDGRIAERRLDAAIVARLRTDRAALAELYDRHGNTVYSLARRIVGSRSDAEDVVQEVFTQAWRQAERYDAERASAAGWLLNMTRSRAIDRVRANRSREGVLADDDRIVAATGPGGDQEQQAIDTEEAGRVRVALDALGKAQREAIELAYFGGLTQSEISTRLGAPLGTVKTRIRSGLLKLRDALAGRT